MRACQLMHLWLTHRHRGQAKNVGGGLPPMRACQLMHLQLTHSYLRPPHIWIKYNLGLTGFPGHAPTTG